MIQKAPIEKQHTFEKTCHEAQRDADHKWYLQQFVAWGEEPCLEHVAIGYTGGNNRLRRECPKCIKALKKEVGV